MTRRIAVVTGSRAEYGLLRPLLEDLRDSDAVELRLIVTGAHLDQRFGSSYREIEADGFTIDTRVDLGLSGDSALAVSRAMGRAVSGIAEALDALRPDILVLLGDRYEILAAASAALVARIPVAHLHGGELTEGAFDDAIRHAVTKMSHLHFVAADEYRQRVLQLGEQPERVFLVGGLGVDAIKRTQLMDRGQLEQALGVRFRARNLLITFHPATLDDADSGAQMRELLAALEPLDDTTLIFTGANADPGHRAVMDAVQQFVDAHDNAALFASLGQRRYFSCLDVVDGVVGNSSSGLTEMPSFGRGTVNIGDRQRGRLRAASVIDCPPERRAIAAAIARLYTPDFRARASRAANPYGDGGASRRIADCLETYPLDGLGTKQFVCQEAYECSRAQSAGDGSSWGARPAP